jgi:predicted DCC family thiol-disulfide oxidoreductase YuxK
MKAERHPILLYDGICGLCNRTVQFVLKRDARGIFLFAALQSAFAHRVLGGHHVNPSSLDTFYVLINFDAAQPADERQKETLLARSDALIFVLREIGGVWRWAGNVLRVVPRVLRDWIYNIVARRRYRIFEKYDSCPIPSEETRGRFLDL